MRRWWNWEEYLGQRSVGGQSQKTFEEVQSILKHLYAEYTFEFAAEESGVDAKTIEEIAKVVATAGTRFSSHNWRSVTSGVSHGWSVARCLFMLNALLGAIATEGGVFPNAWNKFVPRPIHTPPHPNVGRDQLARRISAGDARDVFPAPSSAKGRGKPGTYFTRVYNPSGWPVASRGSAHGETVSATALTLSGARPPILPIMLPMGLGLSVTTSIPYETHDARYRFRQPVMRAARGERNDESAILAKIREKSGKRTSSGWS